MRDITCGVLILQDNKLLMCHPTHGKHWDVPKGLKELNESLVDAASRELYEETGFIVNESELTLLGTWNYNFYKDIALFVYIGHKKFNVNTAICTSYFTLGNKQFLEVDSFKFFKKEDAIKNCCLSLQYILSNLLQKL